MKITRRRFLQSAAAGLLIPIAPLEALAADATPKPAPSPLRWVRIAPNGAVTILSNTSEVGQGTSTALAQILADELDLEWSKISIAMAPVEADYANARWGEYGTFGSGGVAGQYDALRKAGALARARLIAAAAERWKVDKGECDTKAGSVVHARSGRKLAYADLVKAAAAMPDPPGMPLIPPSRRRFVGQPIPRLDIPGKVDGSAKYGIDLQLPGMLVAAVKQSPRFGGRLASVDEAPAKAVRGVKQVVKLEDAVAVIAANYWTARKGLDALKPEWDFSKASTLTSPAYEQSLVEATRKGGSLPDPKRRSPEFVKALADHDAAMQQAAAIVESVYTVPFLAHATMEPMNATARVTAKGAELWVPTQSQTAAVNAVAKELKLPPEAITLHTLLCGGGFGRRIEFDFVLQAVRIARQVDAPVKTIWSREEDMQHDFYRPAVAMRLTAAIGTGGRVAAIHLDTACESLLTYSRGGEYAAFVKPADVSAIGERLTIYDVPVIPTVTTVDGGVPVGFWRSVAASQNAFAYESFIDELAARDKADPVAFRLSLLAPNSRERRVLEEAVKRAGWSGVAKDGVHRGVAMVRANGSYVAIIVDLTVGQDAAVRLKRVTAAIDCGLAVNPGAVRAQVEGGVVFGLTAAFFGEITVKDGAVVQSNFHDYPLLTIAQMPPVDVAIVASEQDPSGVGEEAVSPVAPAVANAIFAATGKRIRDLPLARAGFTLQSPA